jgi:hypothetical protein
VLVEIIVFVYHADVFVCVLVVVVLASACRQSGVPLAACIGAATKVEKAVIIMCVFDHSVLCSAFAAYHNTLVSSDIVT